jgi:hypothetical protein
MSADASAPFDALLGDQNGGLDRPAGPGPSPDASHGDGLYASVMAKEASVLELVRRLDETRRAEAMKQSDKIAPLANAFAEGVSGFMARLIHYLSVGATNEAVSLVTSPDGMVYAGTLILLFSLILVFL